MKIAIIGTRGIPNAYGGFEQFAEYLSVFLTQQKHEVWVYNSSLHPYQKNTWKDVNIVHCRDWEGKIGTAGQFLYDFNCIRDARSRRFDIILQLGYTSSSIWARLLPKKAKIITNMDGMEWKRSKFSPMVQKFLKSAEKWAVNSSDVLVADSKGIQNYLTEKYKTPSVFIAYGAPIPDKKSEQTLKSFGLASRQYNMLIARMEPENNIETILDGQVASGSKTPFVVVGKCENNFAKQMTKKYAQNSSILFLGGIYDLTSLNCLRQHCNLYFHGHSVGGTNPSLLEAMGCGAAIVAHENQFNRSVLENDGYYFSTIEDVVKHIQSEINITEVKKNKANNFDKIRNEYNWDNINRQYEELMINTLAERV